jgi:hypothetical protein
MSHKITKYLKAYLIQIKLVYGYIKIIIHRNSCD